MKTLSLVMMAGLSSAQNWPYPDDVARPRPVAVGLAGSAQPDVTRYLLASGPRAPQLSPDGTMLLFISTITGAPQVWVADVAGGAPRQLTFGLGVADARWAPGGKAIVYGADRGGDERFGFYAVTPDGGRETELVGQSAAFTQFGDFVADGFVYATTMRDGRAFDTWIGSLAGSAPRELLRGRLGLYPTLANHAGTAVAMYEARGEDGGDLSLLDVKSGVERSLLRPTEPSQILPVAWAADDRHLYVVSNEGREFNALVLLDTVTGTSRIVEQPANDVLDANLSTDGHYLAWTVDEAGFHVVHVRDLKSGQLLKTPSLPAGRVSVRFARDVPVLGIGINGSATPGEVWTWNCATGAARRVIAPNMAGVDLAGLVVPRSVTFQARDGVPLSGLLYMPRHAAGRAPVLMNLHGGPTEQALTTWRPDLQYLLARGIAVLDFNYRGSTGAGKAHARLNDKRLRPNEITDLLDAKAWIERQPGLDGARVAVRGHSYGGYLTNAVIGKHPGVFVAAVSEAGVADWPRNLRNAEPQLKASDRLEYGNIDDPADAAFLASLSPMNDAARVRTPLLLETGANDPRNGADELDAYVLAIRKGGGTVRYRRYENEGHVLNMLANKVDFNREKAAFLEQAFKR